MEVFRGREPERVRIAQWLRDSRSRPTVSREGVAFRELSRLDDSGGELDRTVMEDIVTKTLTRAATIGIDVPLIPEERYFVGRVIDQTDGDAGGFHSVYGGGFDHVSFSGRTVLHRTTSLRLRTLELARCYLHDCFHAATFKSWRWRGDTHGVPIYREQYGINFRNARDASYSSPRATAMVPEAINLNVLMDGSIVASLAEVFADAVAGIDLAEHCQRQHVADLVGDWDQLSGSPGQQFAQDVVIPTLRFLEAHGGVVCREIVMRAMISGRLNEFDAHLAKARADRSGFKQVFKAPYWRGTGRDHLRA